MRVSGFSTSSGAPGSGTGTGNTGGSIAGDVSGSTSDATVVGIGGFPITGTPAAGEQLTFTGSVWAFGLIWRPLLTSAGAIVTAGAGGEAVMGLSAA